MTNQTSATGGDAGTSVRHEIVVRATPEVAFRTFTEQFDRIKPRRVLAFEPPHRLVISWDITPAWQVESDPARASEVGVTFQAGEPGSTLVRLAHRHLDRHGEGWQGELAAVDSPGGWPLYLGRFAALTGSPG